MASRSSHAAMNWRSVRRVGPKESNSVDRQTVFVVGAAKIGKSFVQVHRSNFRVDRIVDARFDFNIAGIEANLPGMRRGNHNVAADEFAPVHVIAKCGGEQTECDSRVREKSCRPFS